MFIDVAQRSDAWFLYRAGKVPASEVGRVVNGRLKGWRSYMQQLDDEITAKEREDVDTLRFLSGLPTPAMTQGTEREGEALARMAIIFPELVKSPRPAVCTHTSADVLASADGWLEEPRTTFEVKCPDSEHVHAGIIAYGMPEKDIAQVQCQMWCYDAGQGVYGSYFPDYPDPHCKLHYFPVDRNDKYIGKMARQIENFWRIYQEPRRETALIDYFNRRAA